MLHRIILYIIHKCISGFCFIQLIYRNIYSFALHYLSLVTNFVKLEKSTNLKKLPSHIGFIICEDHLSYSDISNLIIWSFCLGIHHISLYDSTGYIKSNGADLYKQMNIRKELILKKKACFFNVIFSDGKFSYPYNTYIKNGHRTDDVYVYLLSQEDGKQQIVEATRNVCKKAKTEPTLLQNFHAQHFKSYIKAIIDIPDPELILLFGQNSGLIGYLPWHIRLTEIITILTHHKIRFEEFQETLLRFNKCEQRFGK